MRRYKPRRFGAKWNAGAPPYVLDVTCNPAFDDCYTVLLTGDTLLYYPPESREYRHCHVQYIGLNRAGRGYWGEMPAHDAASYRYRQKHRRVTWDSLPDAVKREVVYRVEEQEA